MPYTISNGLYTDNDTFESVDLQARLEGIKAWTTLELDPEVRKRRLHELRALAAAGERPSLLLRHGVSGPSGFLERFLADHGLSLVGKPWTLSPKSDHATDHARETLPGSDTPSSGLVLAWELEALPQTSGQAPEREQEVVEASPNEQRDTDAPMSGITEIEGHVRDEDDVSVRTLDDSEMWSAPGDAVASPTPLTVAATGDDVPMENGFTDLHQMELSDVEAISQETQAPLILDSDSE